ncbi:Hypothetical_protein [Hexamita inflata]|uniref:Hypothetical_protein n=1 Tax=Hexamita inflata TaxID=28002 RepID=A0AA86PZ85_9EUKA|nr:Hypothetical protein HINF_LOCUS5759 [Hexamita inflata]CAI9924600.1 Hypothetical protein HINF_LOCUS12245 [Hexamita inflata]CAI9937274.1 Hypothetical protein HINF_LOCUS24919 [Hexamita inflata]CAI9946867.1 Hypothetical protein HINF_LOCUS34512 [Hexamita inflata]CAI9967245.1 Hypothetical protein HINF_LOCUS54890 [Hexamita inflata]
MMLQFISLCNASFKQELQSSMKVCNKQLLIHHTLQIYCQHTLSINDITVNSGDFFFRTFDSGKQTQSIFGLTTRVQNSQFTFSLNGQHISLIFSNQLQIENTQINLTINATSFYGLLHNAISIGIINSQLQIVAHGQNCAAISAQLLHLTFSFVTLSVQLQTTQNATGLANGRGSNFSLQDVNATFQLKTITGCGGIIASWLENSQVSISKCSFQGEVGLAMPLTGLWLGFQIETSLNVQHSQIFIGGQYLGQCAGCQIQYGGGLIKSEY